MPKNQPTAYLRQHPSLNHNSSYVFKFEQVNVSLLLPYSTDMAMCNFLLFPKLKKELYGGR